MHLLKAGPVPSANRPKLLSTREASSCSVSSKQRYITAYSADNKRQSVQLYVKHLYQYHHHQGSANIMEEEMERIQEPEDGEGFCEMISSGQGMAATIRNSQFR